MKVVLKGDTLVLTFVPTPDALRKVRSLPARRYDPTTGHWLVPYTMDSWRALQFLGFALEGIVTPTGNGQLVDAQGALLTVRMPYSAGDAQRCSRIPDYRHWDAGKKLWFCKPTRRNLAYLKDAFPDATWTPAATALYESGLVQPTARAVGLAKEKQALLAQADVAINDYKFGGPTPFLHQKKVFLLSRDQPAFAFLMEQRTGKSKPIVDTAAWLYAQGRIAQVLVIAPNTVKTLWLTEHVPEHMPDHVGWEAAVWASGARRDQREQVAKVLAGGPEKLRWLLMNVEACSTARGYEAALDFVKRAPTLVVVDESSRIKTPGARRTRAITKLGRYAPYRRALTGTPVTQGPLDLYAQFKFLDPSILGFSSFYSFRNHFAVMGGWNGRQVVNYANLDELTRLIEPFSFRITRDECFDLPPKGYQKLIVELTPAQRRAYEQMKQEMIAELESGARVTAPIVLTQLLRLQQIAGGFAAVDGAAVEAIPGPNPKVDAVLELADDVQGKVLVWARFRAEIAAVTAALREKYGAASAAELHGDVSDADRVVAREAFQDPGSPIRFLVGQTETGGLGLDLSQARTVVYFSNSFSLESRLQSEDRAQGPKQQHSVAYVDLVARDTVDAKLLAALRSKQEAARTITGDTWKEWL